MTRFLRLGALAGIGGGLALAACLLVLGEGPIGEAVAIEAAGGHGEDELFTRTQQKVGGAVGSVLVGAALGAVFGVVFAATRHRLPGGTDLARSLWLAAAAFVTIALVPALKYPANPPAVGDPADVEPRTWLYLLLVAAGVLGMVLAGRAAIWLRGRSAADHVVLLAPAGIFVVVVGLALMTFPTPDIDVDLDADLVWRFRVASLGGMLAFWGVTGALLGWLLAPASDRRRRSGAEEGAPTA
jgi:predicted cobalt transporter CbtA